MCLSKDGKKQYYTISGNVNDGTKRTELGNHKVININSSDVEKQIQSSGFKTSVEVNAKELKYNVTPEQVEETEKLLKEGVSSGGGGSGGSSGPVKSGIETQDTVDDRKAEYQEYVLRMKDEPNAEILPFEEWVKNRPSINDVKAV
jgi:hypothetical protein